MGGAVSSGSTNDELVDNLVDGSCIRTREVERAFRMVDRAEYFLPRSRNNAYKDVAWKSVHYHLSAPCVYSEVMEGLCLKPGNSFLNIGSGTGYLSTMAGLLLGTNGVNHGIEIHEDLVCYARHKLEMFKKHSGALDEFEFCEPQFAVGNGLCLSHGKVGDFREYDRVYCGAACPEAFETQVWRLVAVGGILVMPCNDQLLQLRRTAGDTWDACPLLGVTFATLVPPLSDVEYTPLERKEHQRIAMKLFTVTPPTLQHLCRSLIRNTLRVNITRAHPSLYKPARKPAVNPKSSRRPARSAATNGTERQERAPTQRVTLSLGSNGRLNIDRTGAETESYRRARARVLGQRLVHARSADAEGGDGEGGAVGRCAAPNGDAAGRDVGVTGRRALAQAVGNYRVERLLEHLCQEMILEPIADENEQPHDNNQQNLVDLEIFGDAEELLSMELAIDNRSDASSQQETAEEIQQSTPTTTENESQTTQIPSDSTNEAHNSGSSSNVIIIHVNDENDEMDTDSERENLTETENVTIELTPGIKSPATPQANTTMESSPSGSLEPSVGHASTEATTKMDVDFVAENQKPNHRFAGFRFHNQPLDGSAITPTNNKRSSSNSSLKTSSKRRSNNPCRSETSGEEEEDLPSSSSSSSSTSTDTEDDDDDDDSASETARDRRRLGHRAQIVHLLSSRLEANNNLAELSTDDEDDDEEDGEDSEGEEAAGRAGQQEGGDGGAPLVVRSEYTAHMLARIRTLPLPNRLLVYVNYDREVQEELEEQKQGADEKE